MKVTMLTNVYPNKYGKSDGVFVRNQAKMIEEMGNEVEVIYLDLRSIKKKRKWGMEQYNDENIKVYHYSFPCGPIPIVLDILYIIIMQMVLEAYLKKEKNTDVIHGHFYINAFGAKRIKKKYQIKYVLTEHSSELYKTRISMLHKWIMINAYNNVDSLICVSEALKKQMSQYTKREMYVLPNVLPRNFYYSVEQKKNEFVYLYIGHIIKEKGIKLLIQSYEKVQEKLSNTKLIIVGNGCLKKELETIVNEKKLNVEFLGEIKHDNIPSICQKSDCFVMPSEKETFGVVYIEAMACGLPVIATKCGGPEEFVNEQNGVLVAINSQEELINEMITMYNRYSSYNKKEISENILKQYGVESQGIRLMNIYVEGERK